MAIPQLADDFSEFLRLLNFHKVKYLLVGGYAVATYGYVRATNDLDIWVEADPDNAQRIVNALQEFGFPANQLKRELFLTSDQIVRMGVPPLRLEILTSISGLRFKPCYEEREVVQMGNLDVPVISLVRLRENKRAAGRAKDLVDLENLADSP